MYFCYFVIFSPWKRAGPSFEQTWIPFTKGCFVPSLVEIGPVVLENKIFFNFINVFSLFSNLLSLKKGGLLIWTHLNPLHPRILCAMFGWNWFSGSGEEDFLISSMCFLYFIIISPWKRVGPFIWTNLNPLYPRMLCAKFGWNWPRGSRKEDENVKSLQTDGQTGGRTNGRTDGRTDRRRTTGDQKSSLELSVQVS